jgi:hypothetical protein
MSRPDSLSFSTTFTVPSTDGPSSSEVMSSAIDPSASGFAATNASIAVTNAASELHVGGAATVDTVAFVAMLNGSRPIRGDRSARRRCGPKQTEDARRRTASSCW